MANSATPTQARPAEAELRLPERAPGEPKSHWLYRSIHGELAAGRLRPGDRLPATRVLAGSCGVARGTLVDVFDQLKCEGYLETRFGGGTFVTEFPDEAMPGRASGTGTGRDELPIRLSQRCRRMQRPAATGIGLTHTIPFALGATAYNEFPITVWRRLLSRRMQMDPAAILIDRDNRGDLRLREQISDYLRRMRGLDCEPAQIFISGSVPQGLGFLTTLLLDAGDQVWLEDPAYPHMPSVCLRNGLEPVPIAIDEQGLDAGYAESVAPNARLAIVSSTHQDVYGTPMSLERRRALLAWAERRDAWICETDYSSDFRYAGQPVTTLHQLDHGRRVFYAGNVACILFNALRISYLVVPKQLVKPLQQIRSAIDRGPPLLIQATLADFMEQGHFARHMRRMRILYGARLAALRAAVEAHASDLIELAPTHSGNEVIGWLKTDMSAEEARRRAAAVDLSVLPIAEFVQQRPAMREGLMFGFGAWSPAVLEASVVKLAKALRAPAASASASEAA